MLCSLQVFFTDSLKFFLSLYGHKLPVLSLDISSDSTLLVSGSADKNIKVRLGLSLVLHQYNLSDNKDRLIMFASDVFWHCMKAHISHECLPLNACFWPTLYVIELYLLS